MPDTKFSLPALAEHIRKYLWVYLVGIALCLVGTGLLWTTTAPHPLIEETVVVALADTYCNGDPLAPVAEDMLEQTRPFDERLKAVEFQSLMYQEEDYTSSMVLLTRLSVGEIDAFLAGQGAMDALVRSEVLVDLTESVQGGWLAEYGLEPYVAEYQDDETGEHYSIMAGLRLDRLDALREMGALYNEGAYLCVTGNGGNVETTMKALETMVRDLTEGDYAQPENTEPAA